MKNIVVLGAGYASLSFIKNVDASFFEKSRVTLISKYSYHYTSILLHEVVTGVREESTKFQLADILPSNVQFTEATIKEVKAEAVIDEQGNTYPYDILVVGLGFQSDTFGIEGIKEYATPIVDFEGALQLKEKIINKIRAYKNTKDVNDLKFIVCGGGFSGIELISSLAHALKEICHKEGIESSLLSLTCVEAMPNVLPMFSETLIKKGVIYLEGLGIKLATHCKILKCLENGVLVQKGDNQELIEGNTIIWTAGVKGNAVIENSPFFTSGRSKVEINGFLQPINQSEEHKESMKKIYVIGDCAALKDPASGRFYPPTAQIANKQGEYLAKLLMSKINGEEFQQEFSYVSEGTICSLGEEYAIGVLGQKEVTGKIALWLKRFIEMKWRYLLNGLKGVFNGK